MQSTFVLMISKSIQSITLYKYCHVLHRNTNRGAKILFFLYGSYCKRIVHIQIGTKNKTFVMLTLRWFLHLISYLLYYNDLEINK